MASGRQRRGLSEKSLPAPCRADWNSKLGDAVRLSGPLRLHFSYFTPGHDFRGRPYMEPATLGRSRLIRVVVL